ncbi:class I SAM-dependent methyltransferase [Kitasatospora herbaricolor]|uniref:Class I SAM-dependent methyltransferase n=1 Tax=Kitasatospora herbaricolor TaxID=68217 RepID=A0ABZ1WKB3_9ACTN|nr:class I SAM-dependent methyltransferase [Kitasatospora herbaricolor]
MGKVPQEIWERHYADGLDFAPLGADERTVLAEHAAAPEGGGRALEVGCGTGELAVHLAATGYTVDALDRADAALERARARHQGDGVRWLRLDIEHDDPADLDDAGYDLITLRLVLAFIDDRSRVLHALGERLRPGGAVVLTTPQAAHTPADRRGIALDEDELTLLTAGWASVRRLEAGALAVLVLRGPAGAKASPSAAVNCP